jgi:protein translocase SecG subunit
VKTGFIILQLVVSLGLVVLVLLQAKGSGLGKSLDGGGAYHTKKGVEKIVFIATIALATLFLATSLINAFLI